MNKHTFGKEIIAMEPSLRSFAYSLTTNAEDANDLLQDTYLKALVYQDKFENDTNLKAWLYTIMRNTFINNYRRKVKSNTFICHSEEVSYIHNTLSNRSDNADMKISIKEITRTISAIEETQRLPFEMFIDGYKYKEISDHMDISIGTVKSRIFFTRKKLMNSLKDYRGRD
jgi:RNA polymerase sigma-70 factor (ECF subfamily)